MMTSLSHEEVEDAYARWAPVYDAAFAAVMSPGRKAAAAAINRLAGHILDVGIGTGLELPMFDERIKVTGIDLCEPMLDIARKRVAARGLTNVEALLVMDAMSLNFPAASFDAAVGPYVLTVVPDPTRTLDEMARVVKPGGEIVLVNHIGATDGVVAGVEAWLGKRAHKLGWRPQFPWSVIGDWIERRDDIELLERRAVAPMRLFTLVRMRRK
jgi:phosphatidylethanolamine/phosphatidyl-N-methylethanolamine N-methyltransferase